MLTLLSDLPGGHSSPLLFTGPSLREAVVFAIAANASSRARVSASHLRIAFCNSVGSSFSISSSSITGRLSRRNASGAPSKSLACCSRSCHKPQVSSRSDLDTWPSPFPSSTSAAAPVAGGCAWRQALRNRPRRSPQLWTRSGVRRRRGKKLRQNAVGNGVLNCQVTEAAHSPGSAFVWWMKPGPKKIASPGSRRTSAKMFQRERSSRL
mmetsp:Transcript_88407/g.245435  ORF Transcript_88407/g.245435 Transcript_88407/m.245435 type:complete len:209 (+) Transcript_88407:46-672(+)